MAESKNRRLLVLTIAAVVSVAGLALLLVALLTPIGPASFGWFAYAPLADATFAPGGVSPLLLWALLGVVLLVVGVATLGYVVGRFGKRQTR